MKKIVNLKGIFDVWYIDSAYLFVGSMCIFCSGTIFIEDYLRERAQWGAEERTAVE